MGLYEKLKQRRQDGEQLSLNEATYEEFRELWDEGVTTKELAELYNTSPGKITYKRRKLGITTKLLSLENALSNQQLNKSAWEYVMKTADVDSLAKALTHFAFRNGPVEDMHANGQLSQADMKTLNRFMVNRMAYILQCLIDQRWQELLIVIEHYKMYGNHWDPAEPDDGNLREYLLLRLKNLSKTHKRDDPND